MLRDQIWSALSTFHHHIPQEATFMAAAPTGLGASYTSYTSLLQLHQLHQHRSPTLPQPQAIFKVNQGLIQKLKFKSPKWKICHFSSAIYKVLEGIIVFNFVRKKKTPKLLYNSLAFRCPKYIQPCQGNLMLRASLTLAASPFDWKYSWKHLIDSQGKRIICSAPKAELKQPWEGMEWDQHWGRVSLQIPELNPTAPSPKAGECFYSLLFPSIPSDLQHSTLRDVPPTGWVSSGCTKKRNEDLENKRWWLGLLLDRGGELVGFCLSAL